jgi:capsular exopolysaccharide synthesis family protein
LGEITDALRRAREEQQPDERRPQSAPRSPERQSSGGLRPEPSKKRDDAFAISDEATGTWAARAVVVNHRDGISEYYRHFALRVLRELKQRNARSLLVTSALREEGKTTTACNLALALSSLAGGRPVALIDLDLRRPSVKKSLGITADHGIEEVLAGDIELSGACVPTQMGGLDVYPITRPTRHAHELLSGDHFKELVRELNRKYEYLIFDSPPALLVPDVPLALAEIDCAVTVARAGVTSKRAFDEMLAIVDETKLLGVFLNEASAPRHKHQYGYYLDEDAEE